MILSLLFTGAKDVYGWLLLSIMLLLLLLIVTLDGSVTNLLLLSEDVIEVFKLLEILKTNSKIKKKYNK